MSHKVRGQKEELSAIFPFVMKSAGARLKEGTDTLIVFFSLWPIHEVPNLREVGRPESRQGKYLVRSWLVIGWRLIPIRGSSSRGRQANFCMSLQICKFLGSFRYHKFANFLGVPFHKSKSANFYDYSDNCKSLHNSVSKTVLKVVF
jgi:hypothetical protein